MILSNSTALHHTCSDEYSAITTLMWPLRLGPMTLSRMRFGLANIGYNFPYDSRIRTTKVEGIHGEYLGKMVSHTHTQHTSKSVIFWIYGGAFLSGNVDGNVPLAANYADKTNSSAFVVNYKLCPEGTVENAVEDVIDAYNFLLASDYVDDASNVTILGISSGGGLAVRLMQHIALNKEFYGGVTVKNAVLICPWVNYDIENLPKSLVENTVHDLIVHQGVFSYVIPFGPRMAEMSDGKSNYRKVSPIFHSMKGLPKLCVISSDHECTSDETYDLVEKCRKAGVEVKHHSQKYLCHVYALLPFLPEAQAAEKQIVDFLTV